jgi:hypothetical protein
MRAGNPNPPDAAAFYHWLKRAPRARDVAGVLIVDVSTWYGGSAPDWRALDEFLAELGVLTPD